MLSVYNPLLNLNIFRWVSVRASYFKPFIQFTCFGFLFFLVLIDPFLDALGNKPGLVFGLTGPLITLGNL